MNATHNASHRQRRLTPNALDTATELEALPQGATIVDGRGRAWIAMDRHDVNAFTGRTTAQRIFLTAGGGKHALTGMALDVLDDGPVALIHLPQWGGPYDVEEQHGTADETARVIDTRTREYMTPHLSPRAAQRTAAELNLEARQ